MIDGLFDILFRAGLVSPFESPAIWTTAAETHKPNDFCFLGKARQVRSHRSTGGVAEADDLSYGEVIVR
jgi:hypothetical protein